MCFVIVSIWFAVLGKESKKEYLWQSIKDFKLMMSALILMYFDNQSEIINFISKLIYIHVY